MENNPKAIESALSDIPSDGPYLTTDIEPGQLPEQLERAVTISDVPCVCDMLLLSSLTAYSYALPHMFLLHGKPQHIYYPNLMTLVVAPPASGKGAMNNARLLLEPIHEQLMAEGQVAFLPADSSSAAFVTTLAANLGQGIIFETEMDVLTQIWKSDFGNYSAFFRQAYEHERISRARMGLNGGYTEIKHPQLSVLLSGTLNQLSPLLGNRNNGLTSRFLPYVVEDIQAFDRRSFEKGDQLEANGAHAIYKELGKDLLHRWKWLREQDHDCLWCLTEEQAKIMGDFFDDGYRIGMEDMKMPVGFDSIVKRMPPTIKRIGLVLSALRLDMSEPLPEKLYCSDQDFRTLMLLAEKMLIHAGGMILMLPEEESRAAKIVAPRQVDEETLLQELPTTFLTIEAKEAGIRLGLNSRKVERMLVEMRGKGLIKKISHGYYAQTPPAEESMEEMNTATEQK